MEGEKAKKVLDLQREVGEEFGVDLDKAMDKDYSKRTEKQEQAIEEFKKRLKLMSEDKDNIEQQTETAKQEGSDLAEQTKIEDSQDFTEKAQAVNERQSSARAVWDEMIKSNPDIAEWMKDNPDFDIADLRENFGDSVADAWAEMHKADSMKQGFVDHVGQSIEDTVANQVSQAKFTGTMHDKQGFEVVTEGTVSIFADKDGNEFTLVGGDVIVDTAGDGSYSVGKSGLVIFRDKDGNLVQRTGFEGLTEKGTMSVDDYANRVRTTLQEQKTAEIQSSETPLPESSKEEPKSEGGKTSIGKEGKQKGGELSSGEKEKSPDSNKTTDTATISLKGGTALSQSEDSSSNGKGTTKSSDSQENNETLTFKDGTPIPMDEKGEPDFTKMTPEHGAEKYHEDFGGEAESVIDGEIKQAEKDLKDAKKRKIEGSSYSEKLKSMNEKKAAEAEAQKKIDTLTEIKKALTQQKVAEGVVERPKANAMENASEEVKAAVEKFLNSHKVEGRHGTITLADGTEVEGTYQLVEAEALIPSHDPKNGFKPHKGAPLDAEGRTVNDRDYEHEDKAQDTVLEHSANYNGKAVDNVPVVLSTGHVISGNERTMAGQIAAEKGTDKAYVQSLRKNAEGFGLKAEDVDKMDHPRVVFVPDVDMPYTTETFRLFNKEDKKRQGSTAAAIVNAKTLKPKDVGAIVSEIEGNGTLEAFFNNPKATISLMKTLVQKGIIGTNELDAYIDSNGKLSPEGKEMVKNLLIGSVFSPETIRMLGNDAGLKTKVVNGIRAVLDNLKLGEYSLKDEVDGAVRLLAEARTHGSSVDDLLRQRDAFGENAADRYSNIEQALAKALEGNATLFRDLMREYNDLAAHENSGEAGLFREPLTKEELIRDFIEYSNIIKENSLKTYGNERNNEKEGGDNASGNEEHKGTSGGGDAASESQQEVEEAVKAIATEITKQTGVEVVTDERTGQEVIDNDSDIRPMRSGEITKKASGETVSTPRDGGKDSVVSPKADAKVQQKLDKTKSEYQKAPTNSTRGFITDVSKALGLTQHGASQYGTFELPNGEKVTIRISNHNARISRFDENGEDNAISIVISRYRNKGAINDGNAHVVEVFYTKKAIEQSKDKPLADIIDSIKEAVTTGEYSDKTGIGQVREYNIRDREFRGKNGEVYGFVHDGKIYLDTKKMKPETPLHEYTHLWTEALKSKNPEEWENVKKLLDEVEGLKEDVQKLYPELKGDDLYDEMLAIYSGREGTKKMEAEARRLAKEEGKTLTESVKAKGFIEKVKTALQKYWKGVADMLHIHFTNAEEVADKVLADWAKGVKPGEEKDKRKEDPSDPSEGMKSEAERFHTERVDKTRKAYEEAKASGDASETKRTRDEYRKALDDKLKAQGVGLVERRKTIAKELGEEAKGKGTNADEGNKPWKEMTPAERAAKADSNPMTEEEIRNGVSEENEELAEAAVAYINGDKSLLNQIAYLKIYDDVRNRHENVPGNSGTEDGTQLDTADNGGSQGLGLDGGRTGGGTAEPVDRGTGGETAPGEPKSGTAGEGGTVAPAGKQGDKQGEGNTSGLGGLSAGGTNAEGSGTAGSQRSVGKRGGRGSSRRSAKPDAKRKPAAKQGTTYPNTEGRDTKKELKDAKSALKDAFAEFRKRGKRGSVSISLVGMNTEQIE